MNSSHRHNMRYNKGKWSSEENERFEKAFFAYECDWKLIKKAVGTRSMIQVRSHAQKVVPKLLEKRPRFCRRDLESSLLQTPSISTKDLNPSELLGKWMYHFVSAQFLHNRMNSNQKSDGSIFQKAGDQNQTSED